MMIMAEVAACKWGKQNKFWKLAQNAAKCCTTCILRNEIFARLVHHLHYFAKMYDILYSMGKMSSTWKAQNYYNLVLPTYVSVGRNIYHKEIFSSDYIAMIIIRNSRLPKVKKNQTFHNHNMKWSYTVWLLLQEETKKSTTR